MTADLHDTIRRLLPHRDFTISTRRIDTRTVVVAHCRCGRKLDMLDSIDGSVLLWWLADHDDEMFLSPGELAAKQEEQLHRVTFGAGPGASSLRAQVSAQFPDLAAGLPRPLPWADGAIGAIDD